MPCRDLTLLCFTRFPLSIQFLLQARQRLHLPAGDSEGHVALGCWNWGASGGLLYTAASSELHNLTLVQDNNHPLSALPSKPGGDRWAGTFIRNRGIVEYVHKGGGSNPVLYLIILCI